MTAALFDNVLVRRAVATAIDKHFISQSMAGAVVPLDQLVAQAEALPQADPQRIAAYPEIDDLAINQDVAMVVLGEPQRIGLASERTRDDAISVIIGGWPILEAAWIAEA